MVPEVASAEPSTMLEVGQATPPQGREGCPWVEIRPLRSLLDFGLRELWEYRNLVWILAWREIKIRYKQTVIGAAWAIIQPLGAVVVFSVFLGKLAKIPSDGLPYPVFAYSGMLLWSYFAGGLGSCSMSVVSNRGFLTKIYFPRLVLPLHSLLPGIVDLGLATLFLGVLMGYYGVYPSPMVWLTPVFVILALLAALSVGLWLAALNVKYRDFRYVLGFFTQIWMFATPVVYPASLVPERWRPLFGINPMAGAVEGFRWALTGQGSPPGAMIGVSVLVTCLLLLGGLVCFRQMEREFADVI